jgi:hypothetical protein
MGTQRKAVKKTRAVCSIKADSIKPPYLLFHMAEAQGKPSRYAFIGKTLFRVRVTRTDGQAIQMHKVNMVMKSTREFEKDASGVELHLYTNGSIVYGNKSFVNIGYHQFAVTNKWKVTGWDLSGTPGTDLPTFIRTIQDTSALKNPNGDFTLFFDEHVEGKLTLVASFSFDGPEPGQRIRQRLTVKASWIPEEVFPIRAADPERARMPIEELAKALKSDFWSC